MKNTVELIGVYGGDETHALSAWTSTSRDLTDEKRERIPELLAMLAENGHHTPFEKSFLHFLVTCDTATHIHILKHRIGVSCLDGSQELKFLSTNMDTSPKLTFTMEELFEKWHSGRKHQNTNADMAYTRRRISNMRLRSVDMESGLASHTKILDVLYMGRKPIYTWAAGDSTLRCTSDHMVWTSNGWMGIGDAENSGHGVAVLRHRGSGVLPPQTPPPTNVEWRTVAGTNGMYEVSNTGLVRSRYNNRHIGADFVEKKQTLVGRGYMVVSIAGRGRTFVHALVLEAFVGPKPEGCECRHIDNRPWNNVVGNLRWGSSAENKADWGPSGNARMRMAFERIRLAGDHGERDVYDISVAHPEHAFCAGDFVVHNCNAESARYRELLADRALIPDDWPDSLKSLLQEHCDASYARYHAAITELQRLGYDRKRAKESARFFLPYANQLTLDVSFNFRSFMHFVELRNAPEAQKEIRDVAAEMVRLVRGTGKFNASLDAFGW